MKQKIDFVILWVDGNDKSWQKEKEKYDPNTKKYENNEVRFRDWDNLKYWFRGVEKYASWVNKIYFITWGHIPKWLNTNNKKLKIVNHKDFIPEEYLPTFSSNTIELNIHRIKSLSEYFVLFNDDVFLINNTLPSDFFLKGLPCDNYNEVNWNPGAENELFASTILNNYKILDKYYNKRLEIIKKPLKYINPKYGLKRNLQNIKTTATKKNFVGINNNHITQSFLKSYFNKVWDLEFETLNETSKHKFRNGKDVTNYLIRYFQLMDKKFKPRNYELGRFFIVGEDNSKLIETIKGNKYKVICINDSDENIDFEKCKNEINKAFEQKLYEKSSFEK